MWLSSSRGPYSSGSPATEAGTCEVNITERLLDNSGNPTREVVHQYHRQIVAMSERPYPYHRIDSGPWAGYVIDARTLLERALLSEGRM